MRTEPTTLSSTTILASATFEASFGSRELVAFGMPLIRFEESKTATSFSSTTLIAIPGVTSSAASTGISAAELLMVSVLSASMRSSMRLAVVSARVSMLDAV